MVISLALLDDLLSFLSTKEKGAFFNEIARYLCKKGHTPLDARGKGLHPKKLTQLLRRAYGEGLIISDKKPGRGARTGSKNPYKLSKRGARYLKNHKIRNLFGRVGIEFAEEMYKQGYDVEFLNVLSEVKEHENILFAWHPKKRDVKLCVLFPAKRFDKYVGFKTKGKDQPILTHDLKDYLKIQVRDFSNLEEISKALKSFYDYPNTHDAYFAQTSPTDQIHFGLPVISINPSYTAFACVAYHKDPPPVKMEGALTIFGWDEAEHLKLRCSMELEFQTLYEEATSLILNIKSLTKKPFRIRLKPTCIDLRKDGACAHYSNSRKCAMKELLDEGINELEAIKSCEVLVKDLENIHKARIPQLSKQRQKEDSTNLVIPLTEHSIFHCHPIADSTKLKKLLLRLSRVPQRKHQKILSKEIYRAVGFNRCKLECINCKLACSYPNNPLGCPIIIEELSKKLNIEALMGK